jgi:hypothetical protein
VLINIAQRNGLTLAQCMSHAYDEIKDRKGRTVNGTFIKERIDQSAEGVYNAN